MTSIPQLTIPAFRELLAREDIHRFSLAWREGSLQASHEILQPLADWMAADPRDFDQHEGFFVEVEPRTGSLMGACIHRTCRGQGAGGVRLWTYPDVESYLRDGLRLSRGMTHKNALAGLWWGGGKGVVARTADVVGTKRRQLYEAYGRLITSLEGCYVTAEDVGTSVEDMAAVFATTRFTTCIPQSLGGSGNPSVPTARGVVRGMEAALQHVGLGELRGKRVAVQGLGHVGGPLVDMLAARDVTRVLGHDLDPRRIDAAQQRHPQMFEVVDDPLAADVDVIAPCAVGGTLNPTSIPKIRARVVCGAANNQLEDPQRDDRALRAAGITYVPDFLVNRMGIVTCADEQSGYVRPDPQIERHLGRDWPGGIFQLTLRVLAEADDTETPPGAIALNMAENASRELHPLSGHRGIAIIEGLVREGWAKNHMIPSHFGAQ